MRKRRDKGCHVETKPILCKCTEPPTPNSRDGDGVQCLSCGVETPLRVCAVCAVLVSSCVCLEPVGLVVHQSFASCYFVHDDDMWCSTEHTLAQL